MERADRGIHHSRRAAHAAHDPRPTICHAPFTFFSPELIHPRQRRLSCDAWFMRRGKPPCIRRPSRPAPRRPPHDWRPPPGYRPRLRPPRSAHDEERHHLNDLLADCHDFAARSLAHDDSS
jgi:hypothetical protein